MTVFSAVSPPSPTRDPLRWTRRITLTRAAAAVLWAVVFVSVLHGRQVPTGSDILLGAGFLLAAYPLIDVAASLFERRTGQRRADLHAALAIDGVGILALLVATLTLHTGAVLIAFGAWAFASGLLQLADAWRAEQSRRVQLPLIISGAISAIAGISFAALAAQHIARLTNLAGYAVLGALFYLLWTLIVRTSPRPRTGRD